MDPIESKVPFDGHPSVMEYDRGVIEVASTECNRPSPIFEPPGKLTFPEWLGQNPFVLDEARLPSMRGRALEVNPLPVCLALPLPALRSWSHAVSSCLGH